MPLWPAQPPATARARLQTLLVLACVVCAGPVTGQQLVYVEPGVAACPAPAAPDSGAAVTVVRGARLPGRLSVACGFEQGSYTVTLQATDPDATFAPKTFIVNFGRVVGNGAFAVTFASVGTHSLSATITSNMGSPPVRGRFVSTTSEFRVVSP
jgi:hypothetical protein